MDVTEICKLEAEVDMPLGVSEADNRGAGPHFDGFTYQGS